MPGYLYKSEFIPIQPYSGPLDLYAKSLMLKDEKFRAGLANVRSKYDAILNTQLTNDQNQQKLRAGVEGVMNQLSKVAATDVSLPENQAQINGLFDPIANDSNIIYDSAWTRGYQSEVNKAETLQRQKPELVPPQNLEPLYMAQENYRKGDPNKRPGGVKFSPYYDFNSKMNVELDKVKADVDVMFSNSTAQVEGPDGKMHNVAMPTQYTVKQLKAYTVNQLVWRRLNSDAQALNQMSLDFNYNKNHGFYSPDLAQDQIKDEVSTYKTMASVYSSALNLGVNPETGMPLTGTEKDTFTQKQTSINTRLNELQSLSNDIKMDPNKSSDWFTFNRYVKDYVEGKADQYSFTERGLVSEMPYYNAMIKSQFDAYADKFKEDAKAKVAAKKDQDALDAVPVPYAELMTRLDSSPNGIPATKDEIQALGQMDKDSQGRLFTNIVDKSSPGGSLIVAPASGTFTPQQIKTVDANLLIAKMKKELEGIGIQSTRATKMINTDFPSAGNASVKDVDADEILDNYNLYSTGKYPTPSDDYAWRPSISQEQATAIKAIVGKYAAQLKGLGVDPSNRESLMKVKAELNDPNIKNAVAFGETAKINGRVEFIPDAETNLIAGDNSVMYMKGHIIVPEYKITQVESKRGARALEQISAPWERVTIGGDDGDKFVKRNEDAYSIPAYIPVNGDVTEINDKLLDTKGYQQQWGQKAPEFREASKRKVINFQESLLRAQGLQGVDIPYKQNIEGNYVVDFNTKMLTPEQGKSVETSVKIAQDIALRTGQDYNTVIQQIDNIFATRKTALSRQMAIDSYANSPNSSIINNFKAAISGNESGGDYTTGAKPGQTYNNLGSTAAGKYAFLESTFNYVKSLPEFPEQFKKSSFDDYKNSPVIQESAASALAINYYQKYKDPVIMAVAWFTGPNSEETKAFVENREAAYLKYKNKKPSTGQSLQNMTVGDYIDNFIKNFK